MPVTLNNTNITINDGTNNFVLETVKTHVPEVDIDIDIVPAITYPDTTTRNLQLAAETASGVNGWRIVRFLPPTSTTWYSGNYFTSTNMEVTASLGNAYDYTNEFMVPFGTYDEIFFSTRDMTYWLYTYKTSVLGNYGPGSRNVLKSSSNSNSHTVLWYNRSGNAEDPWISITDHTAATMLYGENNNTVNAGYRNSNGGMCVFVRTSTDTISSSLIPAMPVYEAQTTVTQYPVLPADATNLVAHYKFDDSNSLGLDSNPLTTKYNLTPTIVGGTGGYDALNGVIDASFQATGDGDYLVGDLPLKTLFDNSTTGITVSFWFFKNSGATNDNPYNTLLCKFYNSSNTGLYFVISAGHFNNAHYMNLSFSYTSGETYFNGFANPSPLDTWQHVVVSMDKNKYMKIYINGIDLKASTTSSPAINTSSSSAYPLTSFPNTNKVTIFQNSIAKHTGNIDDFRIYDKALSAYEIDILANNKIENPDYNILTFEYQGPSYPVIDADATSLVTWYKFDDTNDSNPTSTKYNLTNNAVTFVDGKINKCALFDHSSDLLSASTINLSNLLGTEFTFSLWVKVKSGISAYGQVFQYFQDNNNNIYFRRQNANYLGFWIWQNGYLGGGGVLNMPNYIVDVWTHYVITYTGTEAKAYVNGILHQTDAKDGTVFNIGNSTLRIGDRHGLDQHFYGEIDDFRIYDKALSATEISDLYNQYNQTSYTVNFPAESECDILIVGGGGSGGGTSGDGGIENGGGGAGGVLYMVNKKLNGEYKFIVGNGGINSGYDGSDSKIIKNDQVVSYDSIQLIGYGGGGGGSGNTHSQGTYGRSGGSAGGNNYGQTAYTSTATQGNTIWDGTSYIAGGYVGNTRGTGGSHGNTGGGGGGAGGSPIGVNNGGIGVEIDITGVPTYYAGGGGSAGHGVDGVGGLGGGGDPNSSYSNSSLPENGESHTGGGGGGAYTTSTLKKKGGNGGSGIVIIRYNTKYIRQHPAYDAQWTYHSANPNVHHYGNVGIGTLASETNKLTVKGDINVIGDIYENNNKIAYGWDVYDNSVYNQYGNVGIGTNDPRYALHTTGVIYAGQGGITETGSTTWTITSDNRIKENIEKASYDICSENIKNINLYRFNYNTKYVKTTDKNQLGFIAQDVRKYFPKAVKNKTTRFDNDVVPNLLSVDVTQLNYTMYGAVKHIGQDIDAIKEKLGITEVPTEIKNEPYAIEVVPFNDPDAELPIVNEEPATN